MVNLPFFLLNRLYSFFVILSFFGFCSFSLYLAQMLCMIKTDEEYLKYFALIVFMLLKRLTFRFYFVSLLLCFIVDVSL